MLTGLVWRIVLDEEGIRTLDYMQVIRFPWGGSCTRLLPSGEMATVQLVTAPPSWPPPLTTAPPAVLCDQSWPYATHASRPPALPFASLSAIVTLAESVSLARQTSASCQARTSALRQIPRLPTASTSSRLHGVTTNFVQRTVSRRQS